MFVDRLPVLLRHAIFLEALKELFRAQHAGLVALVEVVHIPLQFFGAAVVSDFLPEQVSDVAGGISNAGYCFARLEGSRLIGEESTAFAFFFGKLDSSFARFSGADDLAHVARAEQSGLIFPALRFVAGQCERFSRSFLGLLGEFVELILIDEAALFFAAWSATEDAQDRLIAAKHAKLFSSRFNAEAFGF